MFAMYIDWRSTFGVVGSILLWVTPTYAIPLVAALIYGEAVTPFVAALLVTLGLGLALERLRPPAEDVRLQSRDAFLMIATTWLLVAIVAAIPFVVAGTGTFWNPINALFESMSGITTTGATVLEDFDAHSRSLLLWRQTIQWIGGLGFLLLVSAVLSELAVLGTQLMEREAGSRGITKLTPRLATTVRLITAVYIGVTLLAIGLLYGLYLVGLSEGMTLYNAISHAFTGIGTAGFSPEAASVGAFEPIVQWVIIACMIVGATNFFLLYWLFSGEFGKVTTSTELRAYLASIGVLSAVMALVLAASGTIDGGLEATVRHATFQIVSILTTTGFATADFAAWPSTAQFLLFICMFIGGMAGSTTCSIKTLRWVVVVKSIRRDLFRAIHPDAVRPIRLGDTVIDEDAVRDIYLFVLTAIVLFTIGTLLISLESARIGLDISAFEAMGASAATLLNVGPAFGVAGPFENYGGFSEPTKVAMIVMMWVGRLEIIPVLVLFTAAFWRD